MKWLWFSLLTAFWGICRGDQLNQLSAEYYANYEHWKQIGPFFLPIENYDFKYRSMALPVVNPANEELMDVEVRAGAVTNVTYANSSVFAQQGDPAPNDFVKRSIDDIFELVHAAIENREDIEFIQVFYDDFLSYPSHAQIEYNNGSYLDIFASHFFDRSGPESKREAFEESRALWDSFGPLQNYDFQYRLGCFCDERNRQLMDIKVRYGVVVDVTYAETLQLGFPPFFFNITAGDPAPKGYSAPTVEALFSTIAYAMDPQNDINYCLATFDSSLGYPTYIAQDPYAMYVDDESWRYVTNFCEASEDRLAYEENMALWKTRGPFGTPFVDYDFQYKSKFEENPAYEQLMDIEVRGGVVTNVTYATNSQYGNQGDPAPVDYVKRSVDDIFDKIAEVLSLKGDPDRLQVTYDSALSYPDQTIVHINNTVSAFEVSNLMDKTSIQTKIDAFEEGRALWNSFGPITNYNFQLQKSSFVIDENSQLMYVKVRNGDVVGVTHAKTTEFGNAGDPAPSGYTARTIEEVLRSIALSIFDQDNIFECFATFDSTWGYPTFFYIDPFEDTVDEEESTYIRNFRELNNEDIAYEDNLSKWKLHGISSYDFQYRANSPETGFEYEQLMDVEVRGGAVTSVTYATTTLYANQGDPAPDDFAVLTVDDLFDEIDAAILFIDEAEYFYVSYDIGINYPETLHFRIQNDDIVMSSQFRISNVVPRSSAQSKEDAIISNLALWNSFGPMHNYDFQHQLQIRNVEEYDGDSIGEYNQLMNVKVRNGIVEVTYARNSIYGNANEPAPVDYPARTVHDMFSYLADAIDPNNNVDSCFATFDSNLGYPDYTFVDQSVSVENDQMETFITNFREANEGLSVEGEQTQPLQTGDVQIGTVLTEVLGDSVEVTIDLTGYAEDCCLKETHICNYPMERMFNISACDKVTRYPMQMSRMHDFICDEVGDTFQLDGHAIILCDEQMEGADGSPDGEGWCYGAMYWINFLCV